MCDCKVCEQTFVMTGGESGGEEDTGGAHLPSDDQITIPFTEEQKEELRRKLKQA